MKKVWFFENGKGYLIPIEKIEDLEEEE